MNLQNMNISELQELELNIQKAIKAKASELNIFEEQAQINEFDKKIEDIKNQKQEYVTTTKHTLALNKLGYSIVFYAKNELGIINYNKPKNENKYYGFVLCLNGLTANHNEVAKDDYKAVKDILGLS